MGRRKIFNICIKIIITLFIVSSLISSNVWMKVHAAMVYAENLFYTIEGTSESYEYEELLTRYETYSTAYLRNSITYQIEAYNGTIASENYETLNGQYLLVVSDLEELKSTKEQLVSYRNTLIAVSENDADDIDNLQAANIDTNSDESFIEISENATLIQEIDQQITAIDLQIEQYSTSKASVGTTTAEAKLQEDIASFYKTYQYQLTQEARNRSKLEFQKSLINLIINKEQIQYYNYYKDYLTTLQQVEEIKYKNGLSTTTEVEHAKLDVLKNNNTLLTAQNNYTSLLDKIHYETNIEENSSINYNIDFKKKDYDLDNTINLFIAYNTNYNKLNNLEDSYESFLTSMGVTSYAYYQQVKLMIDDYKLQRKELRYSVEAYAKEAIMQYNTAFLEMEAAKSELSVQDKNCKGMKAKHENKKATLLDLQKAYMDKETATIGYYQSCYSIAVWENILENYMYGEVP